MSIIMLAEKSIPHRYHLDECTSHLPLHRFSVSSHLMVFITHGLQVSKELVFQKYKWKWSTSRRTWWRSQRILYILKAVCYLSEGSALIWIQGLEKFSTLLTNSNVKRRESHWKCLHLPPPRQSLEVHPPASESVSPTKTKDGKRGVKGKLSDWYHDEAKDVLFPFRELFWGVGETSLFSD